MKTGLDTIGNTENEFGRRKRDQMPSVPPKMSPSAQNMKTGLDAHGTPKMSSGAQNMKTGPDALSTAENESGSLKHENGTRRPRYHEKLVRERKTWKREPTPSVLQKRVRTRKT
jgi:hypothetical protein